jgi:hypothetical protein
MIVHGARVDVALLTSSNSDLTTRVASISGAASYEAMRHNQELCQHPSLRYIIHQPSRTRGASDCEFSSRVCDPYRLSSFTYIDDYGPLKTVVNDCEGTVWPLIWEEGFIPGALRGKATGWEAAPKTSKLVQVPNVLMGFICE